MPVWVVWPSRYCVIAKPKLKFSTRLRIKLTHLHAVLRQGPAEGMLAVLSMLLSYGIGRAPLAVWLGMQYGTGGILATLSRLHDRTPLTCKTCRRKGWGAQQWEGQDQLWTGMQSSQHSPRDWHLQLRHLQRTWGLCHQRSSPSSSTPLSC